MKANFEPLGFFIEYWIDGKMIGTKNVDENPHPRKETGYYSTEHKTCNQEISFKNKRKIKEGSKYYTRIYPLNGKHIKQ